MILTCIFIFIAGAFFAVIDTLLHHFDRSIFRDTDRRWSDPTISWRNKYLFLSDGTQVRKKIPGTNLPIPVFFTDAFHFFKGLALFFVVLAIVSYNQTFWIIVDFGLICASYGVGFELFYSVLLLDKTNKK